MRILGISGIDGSMPFKRARWPGRDEREYRMSQGHDSAAVLVVDGAVVAAVAEERLSRQKHTGAFPRMAIAACLAQAGLELSQVDQLVHGFDYAPYRGVFHADAESREQFEQVYSRDALLKLVDRDLPGFPSERVRHVPHHVAHAASAYYTSGWTDCAVLVIDGMGEADSVSIYDAQAGRLNRVSHLGARDSIGILYSLVTLHLGFDFNADEYKIMGLAPYGDPQRFKPVFDDLVQLLPDGGLRIPTLRENRTREEREFYLATRAQLARDLIPARAPDSPVTDDHRDVAAALQSCLDRSLLHLAEHAARSTGHRRLAMAGGVALNCTANGKLLASGRFDEIYVQPAAGDDGSALGAALSAAGDAGETRIGRMPVPFLGPDPAAHEVTQALQAHAGRVQATDLQTLDRACEEAARLIRDGKVVAWFRGRMEFGPRALGHRSILADPGHPEMRDRINAMVKMREAFRPFAPAVSIEQVDRWFDVPSGSDLPYMIVIVNVRPEYRSSLPAITHVDGSARVQTVSSQDNDEFHRLLRAVGRETGREMLLNTSFNVKGQPIVNTPHEAIETFLGTGIDYLFLQNVLVGRRD